MNVGGLRPQASGRHRKSGYRWAVFSRIMAALFGGYAISALATAVLSQLLPRIFGTGRADAVLTATLVSFIWYTVVVIWVFTARSARRAWAGVVVAGLALGLLFLLSRGA